MIVALCGLVLLTVTSPAGSSPAIPQSDGDPARGALAFERRCGGCHSLERNRVGPKLGGVVGRKAGQAPEFRYSPALASWDGRWTEQNLDLWLTNPRALVPGTRMAIRVQDRQSRADIIAHLAQQSD